VFFIVGTVVGLIGLGLVLEPLRSATDYLTAYGEGETQGAGGISPRALHRGCSCRHGDRWLSRAQEVQSQRGDRVRRCQAPLNAWSTSSACSACLHLPLGLQKMILAIWLIAREFNASALASVASDGGSGGSSWKQSCARDTVIPMFLNSNR
jgi:hypothetical protein